MLINSNTPALSCPSLGDIDRAAWVGHCINWFSGSVTNSFILALPCCLRQPRSMCFLSVRMSVYKITPKSCEQIQIKFLASIDDEPVQTHAQRRGCRTGVYFGLPVCVVLYSRITRREKVKWLRGSSDCTGSLPCIVVIENALRCSSCR